MPELPEVEVIARELRAARLAGRCITAVRLYWPRTAATADLAEKLPGERITAIGRRGKYLIFSLGSGRTLILHLRMSGRLLLSGHEEPRGTYERLALIFDDGRALRFHDPRKFGRAWLVDDADEVLGGLGAEPFDDDFTPGALHTLLNTRRRQLKPLLLDQSLIAGLGNIYADEALYEARLHPLRKSDTVTASEAQLLHEAIRTVLERGIRNLGTSLGTGAANYYSVSRRPGRNADELMVFRRTDEPCPRCGTPIARIIIGGRGTHYCPRCQS